jgi:hypothetical protein
MRRGFARVMDHTEILQSLSDKDRMHHEARAARQAG